MKYLKTYELFGLFKKKEYIESNVLLNYTDEISDIFLDLTDRGIKVDIVLTDKSESIDHYGIKIWSDNKFLYADIVETLKFGLAYIKKNIGLVPSRYHLHFYKRRNHFENWGIGYTKLKEFDKGLISNENDLEIGSIFIYF